MSPGDFRFTARSGTAGPEQLARALRRGIERAKREIAELRVKGGQYAAPREQETDTPESRAFWGAR